MRGHGCENMDISALRSAVYASTKERPRELEAKAFLKDVMGLLSARTKNPRACRLPGFTHPPVVLTFAAQLAHFLQDEVLLYASKAVRGAPVVVSPYVGGVVLDHAEMMQRQATKRFMSCDVLNIATQNPGRIGLTALGSTEILSWRLWAISNELIERDIHICVLPGARFPIGARLPDDFPYVWYGIKSSGWDGTGILGNG